MPDEYNELEQLTSSIKAGAFIAPEGYEPSTEHEHSDSFTTLREATHRGKKIEIYTTYRILIDGEPLNVHTMVSNDGKVHSHSLPQYSFASTVDMVRKIIDVFDAERPKNELGTEHDHTHGED